MTISLSDYKHLTQDEAKVYTENGLESNNRMRAVCCDICKYFTYTKLNGPKCGTCRSALITVVYSDVELAERNRQST